VKLCSAGRPHCGVIRHATKFSVGENTAYIHSTENQVLCHPCLSLATLSKGQVELIQGETFTQAEWDHLVEQVQLRVVPEWLKINAVQDAKSDAVVADQNDDPLLCPIATEEKQGVFEIIPSFSFDSVTSEEGLEKKEDKLHFSMEERLGKIELRLRTLKNKLTAPFLDINASYAILTSDVVKLHNKMKVISGFVGNHRLLIQSVLWSSILYNAAHI
jgi:hypothetical protein